MNLIEKIGMALREHDDKLTHSLEINSFIKKQVHHSTDELLRLAKTLRESVVLTKGTSWRLIHNIQQDLLAMGQSHASFLWTSNLRDKITDHIEHTYGISFNAIKIHPQVIDKTDGKIVFVLYDGAYWGGGNYTLAKDGELLFCTVAEFNLGYNKA